MQDRTPTQVLENGAVRYGVYDDAGNLLRYEYIRPEDDPTDEGTPLNKATLLSDETAESLGFDTRKIILKNLLPDSSMEQGSTRWAGGLTNYIFASPTHNRARTGTMSLNFYDTSPNGTDGVPSSSPASMSPMAAISPISGHVYYMSFFGKGFSSNWIDFTMSFGGISAQRTQMYQPEWTLTSAVGTATNEAGCVISVASAGYNAIDDMMLVDLTAAFGAGNEPDKAWCDENIPWFEDTYMYVKADPTVDDALATIPPVLGNDDPEESTVGAIGRRYINTNSGGLFVCIGNTDGKYDWVKIAGTKKTLVTEVITTSQDWRRPATLAGDSIMVRVFGGGGGGGSSMSVGNVGTNTNTTTYGGGGGGGGHMAVKTIPVSALPGAVSITIGTGGTAGTSTSNTGGTGGITSFGSFVSASGGSGGSYYGGGDGGSGGGGSGAINSRDSDISGGSSGGSGSYGGGGGNGGGGGTYGGGGGGRGIYNFPDSYTSGSGGSGRNGQVSGGASTPKLSGASYRYYLGGGGGGGYSSSGGSGSYLNSNSSSTPSTPRGGTGGSGLNTMDLQVDFQGTGAAGAPDPSSVYNCGGGGGGGYGGAGGAGGTYGGGGGGGYGGVGGRGAYTGGGGGGGYGGNGLDAYMINSSYYAGGGGGGYGTQNYGSGGRGQSSGRSGVCIIQYYAYM